jgi:N-acetylmuramoyl-L-alanine amidase
MTWEWVKVVAVVLFAMAAGAACYHQYLAQHHMLRTERQAAVEEEPEPIEQSYIMTPEEIEEEEKADELELMAICVEAEAGNQSLTGKRMVADVILNRVDNPDFPDTIQGVIFQKYHFSSYWDGGMDRVVEPSEETILAVQMELQERGWPGLLYFTAGEWPEYGTPWKKVGDHYFATK